MNANWETCDRCDYDTHQCPGCGEPLQHGTEVCAGCLQLEGDMPEGQDCNGCGMPLHPGFKRCAPCSERA